MKLIHIGTHIEGGVRPDAVLVFELLRGIPQLPKSLRGFTASLAMPWFYKNDWYFEPCAWRNKWGRQYPVVDWWFRFNAFGKLNNELSLVWFNL